MTIESIKKLIGEEMVEEIVNADEEVEIEDWDSVEVGHCRDWDGTDMYEDVVSYSALISYHYDGSFSIKYKIGWEEFDDEDEIVEYIIENYQNLY